MKNIIVTAIGSMSAECVISGLIRLGWNVIGLDIYPRAYHPIAAKCHAFYQVPRFDSPDYVPALINIAKENSADYILPLTDPEIDTFVENRRAFSDAGITLLIAPNDVLSLCRDKNKLAQKLSRCTTFKTIPTYLTLTDATLAFPNVSRFVAKKVNGRSSEGILFGSAGELSGHDLSGYVIQPFIEGNIHCVDIASDGKGTIVACPREELLRTKNGAGVVVRASDPEIFLPLVREVVDNLGIIGCMNFEFIAAADGAYYLMDINPRFSAGVGFSALMGFDVVPLHLAAFGLASASHPNLTAQVGDILVKRTVEYKS